MSEGEAAKDIKRIKSVSRGAALTEAKGKPGEGSEPEGPKTPGEDEADEILANLEKLVGFKPPEPKD